MNFSRYVQDAVKKYERALTRYEEFKAYLGRNRRHPYRVFLPQLEQEMLTARNVRNVALEQQHWANYRKRYIIERIEFIRNAKTESNINRLVNNTRKLINGSVIYLNKATREKLIKNLNNAKASAKANVERNGTIKLYRNIERKIALIRKAGPNSNIPKLVQNAVNAVANLPNKNTRNKYYANINQARIMNRNGPSAWRRGLTAEQLEREAIIKGPAKRSWYNTRLSQM